jgi:prepilin-type N-terminal cleavage/methylation domain-containing protein
MHAAEEHGFTLVELLVAMALALVVFGATLTALDTFQRANASDLQRNENQDNARNAMDRMARALRNVIAPGEKYAGALEAAGEYSLMFQTVDTSSSTFGEKNAAHAMRVRYCLDNSKPTEEVLWTQVQKWTGIVEAPAAPSTSSCPAAVTTGGWETATRLVQHVTNEVSVEQKRPLFTYSASEVPQIITVEMNLFLELSPGRRPGETQLTSGVSLRNSNRKPVASFTVTPEAGVYRFNASESYDPGGLALSYKWWENGTLLSNTSQIFTKKLESGQKYKFKLEVTNPGGLIAETPEKLVEPK